VSFRCFVDNFDVLSTKEQLVDESLGEAFLGGLQTLRPIFSLVSLRSAIAFLPHLKKSLVTAMHMWVFMQTISTCFSIVYICSIQLSIRRVVKILILVLKRHISVHALIQDLDFHHRACLCSVI